MADDQQDIPYDQVADLIRQGTDVNNPNLATLVTQAVAQPPQPASQPPSLNSQSVAPPQPQQPLPNGLDNILAAPSAVTAQPAIAQSDVSTDIPHDLDAILGDGKTKTTPSPGDMIKMASGVDNVDWKTIPQRLAYGLTEPLVGASQLISHGLNAVGIPLPADSTPDKMDAYANAYEQGYQKKFPDEGIDIPRIAGNIVSPTNALLPLKAINKIESGGSALMRLAKSGLAGGTMGLTQPTDDSGDVSYAGAKTAQVLKDAATGAAVSYGGNKVADMINPKISDDAKTLLDNNIRVSTDQLGGTPGGSKLTSVPAIGGLINERHNDAVKDLNTAVFNKALSAVGEKLPPTAPQFGNDALAYTRQRLSDNYDQLLPTLKGNLNDQTTNSMGQYLIRDANDPVIGGDQPMSFQQKFSSLMQTKYPTMDVDAANKAGQILTKRISGVVNNDGSFDGNQFKQMESGLNNDIQKYSKSPDPDHQDIAGVLRDTKGLLKDQLVASDPQGAAALQNINRGYAMFKTAQRAASSTAAPNGVFNPTQLYAAVKNNDGSLSKRDFTEGTLPLYDLASAAKNVLSDYKDSGTAARGLTAALYGSLATGGATAALSHPIGGLAMTGKALEYTKPGQAVGRYLMTNRPAVASPLATLVRRATDVSAISPYAH